MIINGQEKDYPSGISVTQLLDRLNLSPNKIVVEINYELIPAEKYDLTILNQEDSVEIVRFVGGG